MHLQLPVRIWTEGTYLFHSQLSSILFRTQHCHFSYWNFQNQIRLDCISKLIFKVFQNCWSSHMVLRTEYFFNFSFTDWWVLEFWTRVFLLAFHTSSLPKKLMQLNFVWTPLNVFWLWQILPDFYKTEVLWNCKNLWKQALTWVLFFSLLLNGVFFSLLYTDHPTEVLFWFWFFLALYHFILYQVIQELSRLQNLHMLYNTTAKERKKLTYFTFPQRTDPDSITTHHFLPHPSFTYLQSSESFQTHNFSLHPFSVRS